MIIIKSSNFCNQILPCEKHETIFHTVHSIRHYVFFAVKPTISKLAVAPALTFSTSERLHKDERVLQHAVS
jgi:hypothetical protein